MNFLKDTNIHLENRHESRIFFVFIWILYALVYMTKNCFSGALADIVAEGALTLTEASIISGAFYLVYTPLQILGGVFADKYSPEKLITIGLLGSAAANLVIFFCQSFWIMLIAWCFSAAIQFSLWPAVYKIISSQLVRSDRSKMIFFISFASSGGLLLTYVVSALIPRWEYNFAISVVVLTSLAVVLLLFCKHLNPLIKPDKLPPTPVKDASEDAKGRGMGIMKLFLVSGCFAMLGVVLLRQMVENGTKTLSPTMLSQSYESISPMLGNLLNTLIILAGIVGTVILKFLIFPRIIKNEILSILILSALTLPFAVILRFVGTLPPFLIVIALCCVSLLLTPTHLLTQHYNLHFTKYGMNGTVAGILNAAASLGIVLQFFIFGPLAESFGWPIVTTIWIGMVTLTVLCSILALRPFRRFTAENEL